MNFPYWKTKLVFSCFPFIKDLIGWGSGKKKLPKKGALLFIHS